MQIPCSEIWADQSNNKSREMFAPESCHSLAATIQEQGLLQPVVVVPIEHPSYKYRLVFGYRRFVAVSVVLAQKHIEAIVRTDLDEQQIDLANAIENIERQDLSFYEECVCLKNVFDAEMSQTDIGKALKKSRTWVRNRWLLWKLPEDVIQQVRVGLLGAAEVALLIQQTPEEMAEAAAKLLKGKDAGESTASMEREVSGRRGVRAKKDVQRVMTILLEKGREAEMHTLRFACGEISDQQLFEYLGLNDEPNAAAV